MRGFEIKQRNANELEVEIRRDQNLNALFDALTEAEIDVISMRNKANRLEELFFRLTDGKSAPGHDRPYRLP